MGYLRYPDYYSRFRCTASACRHNCCLAGWEIDIDDGTLAYYEQVKGSFGTRLREQIAQQPGQSAYFILDKNGCCPFLNTQNLCDIYTQLGEEHLCQICTEHPRYYDWFSEGTEAGVGLCCEAAAALILGRNNKMNLEMCPDDTFQPEEYSEQERRIERELFAMRDELFDIIEQSDTVDQYMDDLHRAAGDMQDKLDEWICPADDAQPSWTDIFWNEDNLAHTIEFFLTLEINNNTWAELLRRIKDKLPQILQQRQAFFGFYRENLYEYRQLLAYFIYRHFMRARWDGMLLGRVKFALISTCMIQLLDVYTWLTDGCLTQARQIELCGLYSEEIEYDEDNVEKILTQMLL